MNLSWSFGINSEIPENIHNLANANDKWLLYAASNTGVIYDWVNSTQKHLRGHCNEISAIASSKCKRWVITADQGKDSLMIVWEINVRVLKAEMPTICDAVPIKTFFGIHGDKGARSVKFSADAKYIISLGCGN
jgi:WD40 repeat protein